MPPARACTRSTRAAARADGGLRPAARAQHVRRGGGRAAYRRHRARARPPADQFYEPFPSWFEVILDSGISAAAITAILLNLLFNVRRGQPDEAPIFAEAPAIGTTYEGDTEGIVVEHTDTDHPTPTRPTRRASDSHH